MSLLAEYVPPAQRGVVHFTSLPRDMRPPEVCTHFNQYGTILRHKFVPYPKKERRPGGPLMALQYKEGYVEYSSKDDARAAAAYMNNQPVHCKRTRRCYGQLWTVKYLDQFTWDTLVEEREGERRARRAAEVEAQRQERDTNEAYRRLVLQAQRKRREQKRDRSPQHCEEAEEEVENEVDTGADVAVEREKKKLPKAAEKQKSEETEKKRKKSKLAKKEDAPSPKSALKNAKKSAKKLTSKV